MSDLEEQLAQQAPAATNDTSMLFELPPLTVDGIPTQLDKMTQVVTASVLYINTCHMNVHDCVTSCYRTTVAS